MVPWCWEAFLQASLRISPPRLQVGYLVSRTNTRYGALKPWMSAALVPCILCYFCLWLVPDWCRSYLVYDLLTIVIECRALTSNVAAVVSWFVLARS